MDATFVKAGARYTLGLERRLAHSPEKVWRVLTERELVKQWFPADIDGEWKVGATLQFKFLHGEGDGLSDGGRKTRHGVGEASQREVAGSTGSLLEYAEILPARARLSGGDTQLERRASVL